MRHKLNVYILVFAFLAFFSCKGNKQAESQDGSKSASEQADHKPATDDCGEAHWSHHQGEEGPENWKDLCSGFADCGGSAQSPIDIVTGDAQKADNLSAPKFSYGKSKVDIINNGHTVQFNISGENKVDLNGKMYELLQFHYHGLSEHTIDGKSFPLEVHFVHKFSDSDFAVLGFMFEEGKANDLFSKYLDSFPASKGAYSSDDMIDVLSLFPENKSYYNYNGSLTTPPCSEVVNWYVLKTPVTASKEQIEKFSKILDNNFRPVMPLNGRAVGVYSE